MTTPPPPPGAQAGMRLLMQDRRIFNCHTTAADAAYYAELGSSAAVLFAGKQGPWARGGEGWVVFWHGGARAGGGDGGLPVGSRACLPAPVALTEPLLP